MLQYIKDNNLENDSKITNMIYGLINHYTLDTLLHPLINYQVKNLNIPHTKIEFMFDKKIKDTTNNSFFKILIPKLKFSKELINFIDTIFLNTHNVKNIGKVFNRSHNNGYYVYRYFINDKYGIKSFFYKIIDFFTSNKSIKLHQNTFYIKSINPKIYNNENLLWHHPNNKNETYNYSFKELYNIALRISLKLNNDAHKVIHNKKEITELIDSIKLISLQNIPILLKK